MTGRAKDQQLDETPNMNRTHLMVATAAGVVAGVSLLAMIIGITSKGYSVLTRTALLSEQEAMSKTRQRKTRPAQAPLVAPEPTLPSSVLPQLGSLKPSPGPVVATQASRQPANPGATQRVQSRNAVAAPVVLGKSRIAIQAIQGSWIDVCADGQTVLRRFLPQLSSVDLGFSNDAVVRLGNSGGVEISVNGTPTGPLGVIGRTRVVHFDANGFYFLMPGDPGTECGRS